MSCTGCTCSVSGRAWCKQQGVASAEVPVLRAVSFSRGRARNCGKPRLPVTRLLPQVGSHCHLSSYQASWAGLGRCRLARGQVGSGSLAHGDWFILQCHSLALGQKEFQKPRRGLPAEQVPARPAWLSTSSWDATLSHLSCPWCWTQNYSPPYFF